MSKLMQFSWMSWDRKTLRKHITQIGRLFILLIYLVSLLGLPTYSASAADVISFTGEELLGKPTDSSVTVNIIPDEDIEYYYEYGISSGVYTGQTAYATATAGEPHEIVISGLQANTKYYYRMRYHAPGDAMDDWVVRTERSFWTQRAKGSTFTFTIISDSHAMYNAQYQQAIANALADNPDFHFDLGDTFMTDGMTSQNAVNNAYLAQRDPLYLDGIGHSAPIFLASGNHENEEGWNFDDSFSLALASIIARKMYYPTPIEDGFYTGNEDLLPAVEVDGDQHREDYYAWEWGDALFVVIDPFQYTMYNPYGSMAGEGSDDPATGDRWNWTLGGDQFTWFKETIEDSTAKYKFIFAHHMVGGTQSYVRGGAVPAHMFEWGGYNDDGVTWGFDTQRSAWGDDPIHQLMMDNGVSAFFHGHDHQYAYEVRDGIVYQSLPRPSLNLDFNYYSESDPFTEKVLSSSGHLRVIVTPDETTVDYVRSNITEMSYSYTILPNDAPAADYSITASAGPNGSIDPTGQVTVQEGDDQSFDIIPGSGYQVADVLVDGSSVGAVSSYEFTNVQDDHTISASFEASTPESISYVGDIGTAMTKTSGTSLVVTTDQAAAVGDTIIISYVTDPAQNLVVSVSDDAGNTYEEAALAVSWANGRNYIFYASVETALPAGSTITITGDQEVAARMAVVSVFSGLAAEDVLDQALGNPDLADQEALSSDAPTVGPTDTTEQADELLIGVIGTNGPVEDVVGTWQHDFTPGQRIGTTGDADDTNWTLSMGYRIVSAPGEYSAAKSGVTERNFAATIATFKAGEPAPNVPPVAVDDTAATHVDTLVNIDVLDNDSDANGDPLSVTAVSDPPHGSATILGDDTIDYMPDSGYIGDDSFTYDISDGNGGVDSATVHVTITEPGDITYVGDIGTAMTKTSGTSLVVTTDQAAAVGDTIIISYVTDPAQNLVVDVSDSAGNTYEQAALAVNWANGRTYIFYATVASALPAGSTITITGDQEVAARMAVVSVFSGLVNVDVLDQALGNPDIEDQDAPSGTAPTVGPTGTTVQADELLIGVIGTNGPVEDTAGTWQHDFTSGQRIGTTGDAADTNWTLSMGYRIVSSAGEYSAAKSAVTSRNWAATIATFKAADTTPVMPECNILLSRPTDDSVSVSAILDQNGDVYYEYGTESGIYSAGQTSAVTATAGDPVEVVIDGLDPNTQYFYRPRFQAAGTSGWAVGEEHSFHTQRSAGETFTFTIISDSHLGATFSGITPERYDQTTQNVAADNPDFHLDLGDAFLMNEITSQAEANSIYLTQRPYFGNFSHSAPVFLAIGNHENEEGWNFDDTPISKALASMIARKQYFPNPIPDGFYTGNTDLLPEVGSDQFREDYYAWEWGDALFVVLDPFQYTMVKPYGTITGSGEDDDEVVSGDQWTWTLGEQQYTWFEQTLENSNAKYKFVFAHHVVGGQLEVSGTAGTPEYVRGGGMASPYFEWGGLNDDDSWGYDTERSGWENPIHQLMLDNGVVAFFHGHDHQFVHEVVDGIVYQLVPSASMTGYGFDLYDNSPFVVSGGNLPNAGHLRVTVSPAETTVEYVRSEEGGGGINGQVSYDYSIPAPTTPTCYPLTLGHTGEGSDPVASPPNSVGCDPGQYEAGESIILSGAVPAAGWQINGWSGTDDDGSTASSNSLTMPDSVRIAMVIYVDVTPPDTTITAHPDDPSSSANASFEFESTEAGSTFECKLDDGSFISCVSPASYSGLSDGSHTFQVRATDPQSNTDPTPDSFTWVVDTENDPPVITEGEAVGVTMSEDGSPTAFDLALHATDPEADTLTWSIGDQADHGTVSADGTGTTKPVTYSPDADYNGSDTFVVEVSDGQGGMDSITVNVTIDPVNDAPQADAQSILVLKNTAEEITLTASDVDNDPLDFMLVDLTEHGGLSGTPPNLTYTPDTDYLGADSFTFKVNDGTVDSNTAVVSIQVMEDTPPPVFPSSFYGEIHIFDNPPTEGEIVEAFVPGMAGPAATTLITTTIPGDLVYVFDVPGDIDSTPQIEGGVEGDPVTFMIDGRIVAVGEWHSGTNVALNFHPPQADPGDSYSGGEGELINFNGAANDWGSDAVLYQWDWDNDGTYDETGQNLSHSWPDEGVFTVGLKVTDAQGGEGMGTVEVTVTNNAPVLDEIGDRVVDELVLLTFTATATDNDPLSFSLIGEPAGALITTGGIFTWTPTEAQGPDEYHLTVQVCDDGSPALCDDEDITVTVNEVNLAPVLDPIGDQSVVEMNELTFTATAADADVPANNLTFSLIGEPAGASITTGGVFTWTPTDAQGPGEYDLTVQVCDDGSPSLCDDEEITITVEPSTQVHSISLEAGWNLVSFNVQPEDTAIEAVLASIDGSYDLVYAWDASGGFAGDGNWMKYAPPPAPPYQNSLTELDETMGFWIHMTAADMLEVIGTVPTSTDIPLLITVGGWNLMGYPSAVDQSLPEVLSDNGVGEDFTLVYAYDANDVADPWKLFDRDAPEYVNELTEMSPGWGYWIYATADHIWNVTYTP